jgi:hypothetical protein
MSSRCFVLTTFQWWGKQLVREIIAQEVPQDEDAGKRKRRINLPFCKVL